MEDARKSDQESKKGLEENLDVLLALAMTQKELTSSCPSLETLLAWRQGDVKGKQRQELITHLAYCESCYESWLELLETSGIEQSGVPFLSSIKESVHSLKTKFVRMSFGWRIGLTGGGLAAAIAAMLLLTIGIPSYRQPQLNELIGSSYQTYETRTSSKNVPEHWPWAFVQQYQTKDLLSALKKKDSVKEHIHIIGTRAFKSGVRAGLEELRLQTDFWKKVIAGLPPSPQGCEAGAPGASCRQISEVMLEAGKWAALIQVACSAEISSATAMEAADFWETQEKTLLRLSEKVQQSLADDKIKILFANWTVETDKYATPREGLCEGIGPLMNYAFKQ